MNRRTLALAGLAVICLIPTACGKSAGDDSAKRKGDQAFPVEIAEVTAQSLVQTLRAPGTIEAFETIQITTRVAGSLDRLAVAEGDRVAVGDQIAAIDAERYRLTLVTAQAQVARAEADQADARDAATRRDELAKVDRITAEQAQQARLRVLQTDADLAIAKAAAERAALDLKDATVTAPIAGVIQRRDARTGAYLPVGAPLVTLVQRDPLELHFTVPVGDAHRLAVGQKVTAATRGGGASVTAVIRLISDTVDPGTRLVSVVARVDTDHEAALRPGTFVETTIALPPRTVIAVTSLALRSGERGTMAYVFDGQVLHERRVTLDGQTDAGDLIVTSGLTTGERLAVRAGDGLRDGMAVVAVTPGIEAESGTASGAAKHEKHAKPTGDGATTR